MTPTRRQLLSAALGLAGTATLSACGASSGPSAASTKSTAPTATNPPSMPAAAAAPRPGRHRYGQDESQFGDLYRPSGTPQPATIVLIHGGFWLSDYDLTLQLPLARDLVRRGYVVWNLEYRRVGNGGGWPATLQDVAAGIDALATLGVDTTHVVAIGHSAGGQLAAWAAGRGGLSKGSPGAQPRVRVTAVVSQAGVLSLAAAADQGVGGGAVPGLMGGSPSQFPDRYRIADPIAQVPLAVPVLCVHAHDDTNVPFSQSSAYVAAATGAGASATLTAVPGDHFTLIDPTTPAWAAVVAALPRLTSA